MRLRFTLPASLCFGIQPGKTKEIYYREWEKDEYEYFLKVFLRPECFFVYDHDDSEVMKVTWLLNIGPLAILLTRWIA